MSANSLRTATPPPLRRRLDLSDIDSGCRSTQPPDSNASGSGIISHPSVHVSVGATAGGKSRHPAGSHRALLDASSTASGKSLLDDAASASTSAQSIGSGNGATSRSTAIVVGRRQGNNGNGGSHVNRGGGIPPRAYRAAARNRIDEITASAAAIDGDASTVAAAALVPRRPFNRAAARPPPLIAVLVDDASEQAEAAAAAMAAAETAATAAAVPSISAVPLMANTTASESVRSASEDDYLQQAQQHRLGRSSCAAIAINATDGIHVADATVGAGVNLLVGTATADDAPIKAVFTGIDNDSKMQRSMSVCIPRAVYTITQSAATGVVNVGPVSAPTNGMAAVAAALESSASPSATVASRHELQLQSPSRRNNHELQLQSHSRRNSDPAPSHRLRSIWGASSSSSKTPTTAAVATSTTRVRLTPEEGVGAVDSHNTRSEPLLPAAVPQPLSDPSPTIAPESSVALQVEVGRPSSAASISTTCGDDSLVLTHNGRYHHRSTSEGVAAYDTLGIPVWVSARLFTEPVALGLMIAAAAASVVALVLQVYAAAVSG